MLKKLQNLAKREASGALSGKQITVGKRVVKVERLLGEGGFATIYRCVDVDTGETFALKHFILTGYPDAARDADTEVAVMERLAGCPCVVRLHEAALAGPPSAPTSAFALMDFCPDTLVGYLQQQAQLRGSPPLDDAGLLRVALPVARAVQAMHSLSPPLAHRDLKAENVLLGPAGRWVLCDFGSCSARHGVLEGAHEIALEEEVVRKYTTPAYRAPELYDLYAREYVGLPVDIWALGVLLFLLAFGRLPFEGEAKLQVLNGRYSMPEGVSRPAPLRALIADMLRVSPRERPSIHEVLARLAAMAPPEVWEKFPDLHDMRLEAPPPAATQQQAGQQQSAQQRLGLQQQQPAPVRAPAAAAAAGGGPAWHERAPSQNWADFAAPGSPAAALQAAVRAADQAAVAAEAPHVRHGSGAGSGSWATFSPKRGADVDGSPAAGAAPAVSAGSFWSSFGEEAPAEPLLPADAEPTPAPAPAPASQPPVQLMQPQPQAAAVEAAARPAPAVVARPAPAPVARPGPTPVAAVAQPAPRQPAAVPAKLPVQQQPPPQQPPQQPRLPAVEASPLSAGLSRMSQGPVGAAGESSAAKLAVPRPPSVASSQGAAHSRGGSDVGAAMAASEADALRQHCMVLEQLLESRSEEVRRLQQLSEQQAGEIQQLRQQLQGAQQAAQQAGKQAQEQLQKEQQAGREARQALEREQQAAKRAQQQVQQEQQATKQAQQALQREQEALKQAKQALQQEQSRSQQAAAVRGNGVPAPAAAQGPGSRPAQNLSLQVPGGNGTPGGTSGGDPWVSFGTAGSGDAPTPTLLQPAGGSSFRRPDNAASEASAAAGAAGPGASAASGPAASSSAAPIEQTLRSKLGLSSSGLGRPTPPSEALWQQPMRHNSSGAQQYAAAHQGLRSFPVQLTPNASPPGDGSRSAPTSAKPSPARGGISLAAAATLAGGNRSPAQPGSPVQSRLGAGRSGSPSKHKRNVTAPDGAFFADLDPLG